MSELKRFLLIAAIGVFLAWGSHERLSAAFGLPNIDTPMERYYKTTAAQPNYCGRFGDFIYSFPKKYTSWTVEYEGDISWASRENWEVKGCNEKFKSLGFSFDTSGATILQRNSGHDKVRSIEVSLYKAGIGDFVEKMIKIYRDRQLQGSDAFDAGIGLNYFDSKFIFLDRVYWRGATIEAPALYAICSIEAKVPHCNIDFISGRLGARLSLLVRMDDMGLLDSIVERVEGGILKFQVGRVKEGEKSL